MSTYKGQPSHSWVPQAFLGPRNPDLEPTGGTGSPESLQRRELLLPAKAMRGLSAAGQTDDFWQCLGPLSQ